MSAKNLDSFFGRLEAVAALTQNRVFGDAGKAVYQVHKTGEEITLPARSVLEGKKDFSAETDDDAVALVTVVFLDIHRPALKGADRKEIKPAAGDTVTRTVDGVEKKLTVGRLAGLQCYEITNRAYVRVYCQ